MSQLGMGVLINALFSGDHGYEEAAQPCFGKTIASVEMDGNGLVLAFENDPVKLRIYDGGQSCCESRYMTCDDDLAYHVGAELIDIEQAEAGDIAKDEASDECHEVQFLKVRTSLGVITCETHNEHNGYYGGFWIRCELIQPDS